MTVLRQSDTASEVLKARLQYRLDNALPIMRRAVLSIIVVLGFAGTAGAGLIEDAYSAYQRGDYATAASRFRSLAEQGNVRAQYNLGNMYYVGQGVTQDDAETTKWYRKAAEQGHVDSQYALGGMYYAGAGVPQDDAEAVKWYRKAAEQGDAGSQVMLGIVYDAGTGVPQDYVQAHKWLNLAAFRFPASENELRDLAVKNRDHVAAKMTPSQIAEAERLAREWKPKAK